MYLFCCKFTYYTARSITSQLLASVLRVSNRYYSRAWGGCKCSSTLLPSKGCNTTNDSSQMRYFMTFELKGHQTWKLEIWTSKFTLLQQTFWNFFTSVSGKSDNLLGKSSYSISFESRGKYFDCYALCCINSWQSAEFLVVQGLDQL